jgi:hypothetical protein
VDEVSIILEDELKSNEKLIQAYIDYPHSQKAVTLVDYVPKQKRDNILKSNLSKAKSYIQELTYKNRMKEQALQQSSLKQRDR